MHSRSGVTQQGLNVSHKTRGSWGGTSGIRPWSPIADHFLFRGTSTTDIFGSKVVPSINGGPLEVDAVGWEPPKAEVGSGVGAFPYVHQSSSPALYLTCRSSSLGPGSSHSSLGQAQGRQHPSKRSLSFYLCVMRWFSNPFTSFHMCSDLIKSH